MLIMPSKRAEPNKTYVDVESIWFFKSQMPKPVHQPSEAAETTVTNRAVIRALNSG